MKTRFEDTGNLLDDYVQQSDAKKYFLEFGVTQNAEHLMKLARANAAALKMVTGDRFQQKINHMIHQRAVNGQPKQPCAFMGYKLRKVIEPAASTGVDVDVDDDDDDE